MNGSVTWSIEMFPPESVTGMAAIAIWPASLGPGGIETMSSTAPSAHMSAAPSMTPQKPCCEPNAAQGMAMPAKIAMPPSRGSGRVCMRRSPSVRSRTPARDAASETTGVSSTTSRKATANPTAAAW